MPLERARHCESLVAEVFTDLGLPARPTAAFPGPLPTAPYPLEPAMEADTTTMSIRRKLGFSAGREAARRAQALLGRDPIAVPIGQGGAPAWPAGITGSISHTDHLVFAVIVVEPSDQPDRVSIGIDVEQLEESTTMSSRRS